MQNLKNFLSQKRITSKSPKTYQKICSFSSFSSQLLKNDQILKRFKSNNIQKIDHFKKIQSLNPNVNNQIRNYSKEINLLKNNGKKHFNKNSSHTSFSKNCITNQSVLPISIFSKKINSTRRFCTNRLKKIRNIGIIAHVDAGKTTTAEHMLYYAGVLKYIGNVDSGDTFLDYLEMERERGITITSAATKFPWKDHTFNLIDTPGHVDFTVEVERSVRVLDGAVTILDGTAGVQAQTVTVWKQADKYKVPRLIFINKMDRDGASLERSIESLKSKLGAIPVVLQLPFGEGSSLKSVIDLIKMERITFEGNFGENVVIQKLKQGDEFYTQSKQSRDNLLEQLSEYDDHIMEQLLEGQEITEDKIDSTIRNLTLSTQISPVFVGSALKNIGVQPVLDGIIKYLPSPLETSEIRGIQIDSKTGKENSILIKPDEKASLCALAFKVIHDKFKGLITYVRVYSGTLTPGLSIRNTSTGKVEKIPKLYQVSANELHNVSQTLPGDICALIGIKDIKTGDTLSGLQSKTLKLPSITPPQPVFFRTIEPESKSGEKQLLESLEILQIEDPSFHVKEDEETGLLLISGMGELHLEIIADRILKHFKCQARIGKLSIAYKVGFPFEIQEEEFETHLEDTEGVFVPVSFNFSIFPLFESKVSVKLDQDIYIESSKNDREEVKKALISGIQIGIDKGILGYPLMGIQVIIHSVSSLQASSPLVFRRAASKIFFNLHRKYPDNIHYLEPMMKANISTPDTYFGTVISDLTSQRRAIIEHVDQSISENFKERNIFAKVPLSQMIGYSTSIRSITKGSASFVMDFSHYSPLSKQNFERVKHQ